MSQQNRIVSLRAFVYRSPIETPVVTSFGIMNDRPMVLVRLEDDEGAIGWGEIWCNYPSVGAEYRARMVDAVLAPLVIGRPYDEPIEMFSFLSGAVAILALQSGEPGPLAQCIAGIDIALWDLAARRAGQPLWRMLGGIDPHISVYASGINPQSPEKLAAARRADGHCSFKLKVGFGPAHDCANLKAMRTAIGENALLMVDANQAWTLQQAMNEAGAFEPFNISWLEEPLRADRPWEEWRKLADELPFPLAAGENVSGHDNFDALIASGAVGVVQPDMAKWGGFSENLSVARKVVAAGRLFCPHWLGGGIGLLASAHILAAEGGEGMLEVDANENPLRSLFCGPIETVTNGRAKLTEEPGLGIIPDASLLFQFLSPH